MKRIISLSLLLLIASNGFMVTQAHAGLLDALKNLGSQEKRDLAIFCGFGGLALLWVASFKTSTQLSPAIDNLNLHRSVVNDATRTASAKMDSLGRIAGAKQSVKDNSLSILKLLALGIPLVSLAFYLPQKR
jgi:hypothetical protein